MSAQHSALAVATLHYGGSPPQQVVDARQIEQQVQHQVHQAIAQANGQAAQAAAQASAAAVEAGRAARVAQVAGDAPPPLPGEPKVTVNPDGRMTIVSPDGSTTILYPDGRTTHVRPDGAVEQTGVPGGSDDGIPPSVQNVIEGFFFTIAFIAVGMPLARAFGRRLDRSGPKARGAEQSPEANERMERIEHAVDSIAIEVERISEGQRFTTKLLTDRNEGAAFERQATRKDVIGGSAR